MVNTVQWWFSLIGNVWENGNKGWYTKHCNYMDSVLALKPSCGSVFVVFPRIIWTCWMSGIYVHMHTYTKSFLQALLLTNVYWGVWFKSRTKMDSQCFLLKWQCPPGTWQRIPSPVTLSQSNRNREKRLSYLFPWAERVRSGGRSQAFPQYFQEGRSCYCMAWPFPF